LKIGDFVPTGAVDPKFQVEGVATTNHSSSQKTRLNDLSYDIQIWTDLSSILSQITRLTDVRTDRRTDRILVEFSHCMQCGKNCYKTETKNYETETDTETETSIINSIAGEIKANRNALLSNIYYIGCLK